MRIKSAVAALWRNTVVVRAASSAVAALAVGALLWVGVFALANWLLFPMPKPCDGKKLCVLVMGLEGEDFSARRTQHIRDALQAAGNVDVKIVPRLLFRRVWDDAKTARERGRALAQTRLAELRGDVLIGGALLRDGLRLTVFPKRVNARQETVTLPRDFDSAAGAELSAIVFFVAAERGRPALDLAERRVRKIAMPSPASARGLLLHSLGVSLAARGALDQAIWAFREALNDRPREQVPADWAQSSLDLAHVLVRDGRTPRMAEAVAIYRTLSADPDLPLDWGAVRHDYGAALLKLGERENDIGKLQRAATQFWLAMQARQHEPLEWAESQKAFADAHLAVALREPGTRRLNYAISGYRAALQVHNSDRASWGETMVALADALSRLGEREPGTKHLMEAVSTYRAAIPALPSGAQAAAQNSLGNVLMMAAERGEGVAKWEEAVAVYRAALAIWTRTSAPLDWAMAENNLGIALARLGQHDSDTKRLEEAVEAYRAALLERTQARAPLLWATTQNNLASALQSLGERTSDARKLEEAVAACGEALKERRRERSPLQWAITQNNMGNALMSLGKRRYSYWRLKAAVAAYRGALEVFTPDSGSYYQIASENLTIAEALLYQRQNGVQLR